MPTTIHSACDLKYGPYNKNARISVCEIEISNFFQLKVHVFTVDHSSLLAYMEYFCQDQAFHMAISMAQPQHLCKKNTIWKNAIYSITNQDISWRHELVYGAHFRNSKLFWEMPPYGCKCQFLKKS